MIIELDDDERGALAFVMAARHGNIVETRQQTGDEEYTQEDEDEASVLAFMLTDLDVDPDTVASMGPLYDAIWVAIDTPDAFPDLDYAALLAGATKVGYEG